MADLLSNWQGIAGTAIIISVIVSGIALGLGRAFSIKRLERFGVDELIQAMVNAAILGFAVGLSAMVLQVSSEFTPVMQNVTCASNSTPPDYVLCGINSTSVSALSLSGDMLRVQNNIAYYQTLQLHFGNFSIAPLANMDSVSNQLSNSLYSIQLSVFASSLNAQFLSFVSSGWFGVLFASGLVLRSFFLSRKFGAFLIAASIALIIFYPLVLLMFQPPVQGLEAAKSSTSAFLSNAKYQTVPIVDLNNNAVVAVKLYEMGFSGGDDYTGELTLMVQEATAASAALFFYCVVVPVLALAATLVLIKELSGSFAGEIATEISQI